MFAQIRSLRLGVRIALLPGILFAAACAEDSPSAPPEAGASRAAANASTSERLRHTLQEAGFTGTSGSTLQVRLGRSLDPRLAELGRMLWFDSFTGLNDDNSCGGCHSPTNGMGDVGSIAIGIDNNGVVGPGRRGPRNQRRTPMVTNTAFYPTLMWNSRFFSVARDPFDNSRGFIFPPPEGTTLSFLPHLLQAQAFIPPTERTEAAGFAIPGNSDALRAAVLARLNGNAAYQARFREAFPDVRRGAPIDFSHFGRAIAEFEFTLVFADAPIDRFARGEAGAMTEPQQRGALLFFGKAGCVKCHAVAGAANEMFSDFRQHVAGIPQVSPSVGNVPFDGPGANEDFGLEQVTGNPADRYMFRTSPLRNAAVQPAFMHNGAFVSLDAAVRYHLDARRNGPRYTPAGLAPDLRGPTGPLEPVLARLDPLLSRPVTLTEDEAGELIEFVQAGLLDPNARPERLRPLIPASLPSGRPGFEFQFR